MRILRWMLDKPAPLFEAGGRLERFYPLYEAVDTLFFTPGKVTTGTTHVRDALRNAGSLKHPSRTLSSGLVPLSANPGVGRSHDMLSMFSHAEDSAVPQNVLTCR